MTPEQQKNHFDLILVQLQNGITICNNANKGATRTHMAASHLMGIAAYIRELSHELKYDMEDGE